MNPVRSSDPYEASLEALHNLYCQATGRTEKYICNQRDWYEFGKYFTKEDLEAVIRYVLRINRDRDKKYKINLALKSILDLQTFDSLRADAEQERKALAARARKVLPSQGAVEAARMRNEPEPVVEQPEKKLSMDLLIGALRSAPDQKI